MTKILSHHPRRVAVYSNSRNLQLIARKMVFKRAQQNEAEHGEAAVEMSRLDFEDIFCDSFVKDYADQAEKLATRVRISWIRVNIEEQAPRGAEYLLVAHFFNYVQLGEYTTKLRLYSRGCFFFLTNTFEFVDLGEPEEEEG